MSERVSTDEEIEAAFVVINEVVSRLLADADGQVAQLDGYGRLIWINHHFSNWIRTHPLEMQAVWEAMMYTDEYGVESEAWAAQYDKLEELGVFRLVSEGAPFHLRILTAMHFAFQRHWLEVGYPDDFWIQLTTMGHRIQGVDDDQIRQGIAAVQAVLAEQSPRSD